MYELFMQEYLEEAMMEMNRYQGITETAKPGVFKENFYLRDHLQVKISPALAKPKNRDTIVEFIGKFMDEHSTQLGTSGPVYTFTFGEQQVQPLYEMFELTPDMLLEMYDKMVEETYYGKISSVYTGLAKSAPHKLMFTSMLIDALQNGYEDTVECCELMWAFSEYPILYRKFWQTGVKKEVMEWTIEHLGAKFQIKKVSNLKALLQYDAHTSVVYMTDRLKEGDDSVYMDFMYRMRNQIKNKLKNISREYFAANEKGATQHSKSSTFDDGSLADQEGHTTLTAQVVTTTVNKFAVGGINAALARTAAQASKVDKDNLITYLNQIMSTKNNRLGKLVEDIITIFFLKNPTSTGVGSGEFVNFGIILFRSISTSKDPMYQEIHQILNSWMLDIVQIQKLYQRPGTISNYTRAVYNYIVFMIASYN
ncbi:MAG: hypothetical protein K2N48_09235 [Muribaculaceae bacterium]|nr:hypothetical protein [Muribaculaceae bacterium]